MLAPPSEQNVAQSTGQIARCFASELFFQGALNLTASPVWVPQGPGVHFSPILLSVTHGYYINLLRVQRAGIVSRHRHSGPVHAFTLQGTWRYLEHEWSAGTGDYIFEPPGETHTLVVPDATSDMITLFHVTGGYSYLNAQEQIIGFEDVFTKLAAARAHFEANGMPEDALAALIR